MRTTRVWATAALGYLALGYGSLHAQGNVPAIDNLAPASRAAGSGQFTLIVTGTNFRDGATVQWRGSPRYTEPSADGTRLSATIPANDILQAGTAAITVVQRVGQQVRTSAPATFTITASGGGDAGGGSTTPPPTTSNPAPALSSLSPVQARIGGPPFDLNVIGTGFVQGAEVRWGGAARPTTRVSATHLIARIPASDITLPGPVQITAFNPSPGGGTSAALSFERIHYAPTIASLTPKTVAKGGSAFTLVVRGANYLSSGSTVRWNGEDRPTDFVSASQLNAAIPSSDLTEARNIPVIVITRAGQSTKASAVTSLPVYDPATAASAPTTSTTTITTFHVGGSSNPERVFAGQRVPLYTPRSGATPAYWRVSPNASFSGATWNTTATAQYHTFPTSLLGDATGVEATLYFQYRGAAAGDTSNTMSDGIVVRKQFSTDGTIPNVWGEPGSSNPVFGRSTSDKRRLVCAAGQVMTGLRVRQGAWIDAIGIVCAGVNQTMAGNTSGGTLVSGTTCSGTNVPGPYNLTNLGSFLRFNGVTCESNVFRQNTFDPLYARVVGGGASSQASIGCVTTASPVHPDAKSAPIGLDVYFLRIPEVTLAGVVVTPAQTGVSGLAFICAQPD